ncbi:MAG TPA: carbohydrate kinase family protein [Streptosporangiaceae bacterium]|nr:carbohydrate kinase family protein [Streptosporangiaceae bacterium]
MRIAVTGSIATDHLMTFPGRFTEHLLADKIDRVSLSFLVDALEIRRGGVAANISFGLGVLGLRPLLVGAVGPDFGPYRDWLSGHGVDCGGVRESARHHTARFICTTDLDGNQIASFYPGAMSEDAEIGLAPLAARMGGLDLVLIGASDPAAMLSHTEECGTLGIPFAADPSQQLPRLDGPQVCALVDGAAYLFCNEYEEALIEHKSGWSSADVLARVGVRVTTLGPAGARVERSGKPPLLVGPVPERRKADPTGTGDAFRAGFLAAIGWGLSLERAAQLGNLLAVTVLEVAGPQEYELKPAETAERLTGAYGQQAAAEVAAHYG